MLDTKVQKERQNTENRLHFKIKTNINKIQAKQLQFWWYEIQ